MEVVGNYQRDGYAHVRHLIDPEVGQAFLRALREDLGGSFDISSRTDHPNLLVRPAFELYGHHYKPMLFFLWGLTPTVSQLVGRQLLPTYNYLRIYREGDVCRVHSDRFSCEHSLSLTLDYSDGESWDLQVEIPPSVPSARVSHDFEGNPFASIPMQVGDAVLYQGVNHRHGRTAPNRNQWSAHLFLHWVDAEGPYRDHAFDGHGRAAKVNFSFT